jgi:hypothetical protein
MLPEMIESFYSEDKIRKKRDKVDRLIDKIKEPEFDFSKVTPEEYELLQQYEPQIAQFVEEKNPTLVLAQSEGALRGREAQMNALDKYRNLSQSGDDTQSRILRERALMDAATQNQAQQASIQDSFARRGQMGSGNALVAALMAQQGSSQNASQAAQQAAMDAYNTKLNALRQSADLGGVIRGEDVSLESANAGTLNDYNQRFATTKNRYNQYAADTRNQANLRNIEEAQRLANMNVDNRNQSNTDYLNRFNDLQQRQFSNQMGKQGLRVGNMQDRIGDDKQTSQNRQSINRQTQSDIMSIIPATAAGSSSRASADKNSSHTKQVNNSATNDDAAERQQGYFYA